GTEAARQSGKEDGGGKQKEDAHESHGGSWKNSTLKYYSMFRLKRKAFQTEHALTGPQGNEDAKSKRPGPGGCRGPMSATEKRHGAEDGDVLKIYSLKYWQVVICPPSDDLPMPCLCAKENQEKLRCLRIGCRRRGRRNVFAVSPDQGVST
ncbi:hypothetical protein, partial [uncultured Desulfovibrio sp.]|uniref:hypothetical protein n=1 Tax=uncultured Desulfovibrio sp. TaxID=167968 RepID=UPI0032078933